MKDVKKLLKIAGLLKRQKKVMYSVRSEYTNYINICLN